MGSIMLDLIRCFLDLACELQSRSNHMCKELRTRISAFRLLAEVVGRDIQECTQAGQSEAPSSCDCEYGYFAGTGNQEKSATEERDGLHSCIPFFHGYDLLCLGAEAFSGGFFLGSSHQTMFRDVWRRYRLANPHFPFLPAAGLSCSCPI